jgi:hypothetical protein
MVRLNNSQGGGSGGSLFLETNGTPNGSQALLNLAAGSNVTLTDNGSGQVTIASSGGGGSPSIGGTITGGTQYSVLFVNPAGTIAQDKNNFYFYDSATGNAANTPVAFSVGTSGDFTGTDSINTYAQMDAYLPNSAITNSLTGFNTDGAFPGYTASSSRGTGASPVILNTLDTVGGFSGWGYTGATPTYQNLGGMMVTAVGATANNLGGQLDFYTKANNGILALNMSLLNSGKQLNLFGGSKGIIGDPSNYNWFFGDAGNTTATGQFNTAVGHNALIAVAGGASNMGIGLGSFGATTSGGRNAGIGVNTGANNVTGSDNVAIGNNTMVGVSGNSFNKNVALGANAGNNITTASSSVFLGFTAGYNVTTQSNTFLLNNIQQASYANDQAYSLLYGTFSGTAGSLSGQQLTVNGALSVTGTTTLATGLNGLLTAASGVISAAATSAYVASVSNSDSTLTITPTTGSVVASLNLSNPNTWTAEQQITLTTTQFQLNYDGSNNTSFTVGSTGNLTVTPSGNVITLGGSLITGTIAANLYLPTSGGAVNQTASQYQFAGSANNTGHVFLGGSTSTSVTSGRNYSNVVVASSPATVPASGTIPFAANLVANTLGTITIGGGGSVTNTASLYVGAASTQGTNNYALYSAGGLNYFSGHLSVEGVTSTGATGTGAFVFGTSPSVSGATMTTTTVNGVTLTTGGGTTTFLNANGTYTTPAGGTGFTWSTVSGTTQSAAINNGYIPTNSSLTTITLPSTAVVGSIVAIAGQGSGSWKVAQNSGQTIHFASQNTTTGTGGSLTTTNQYDSIELICVTANTDWVVRSSVGNIYIN